MSFDTKVYSLAVSFLLDVITTDPRYSALADELAQDIQDCVDDYLETSLHPETVQRAMHDLLMNTPDSLGG